MKGLLTGMAALALLSLAVLASASITVDTVTIGDPGNAADTTGYGAVSYTYNIGKYEVTAGQYAAFLNAVAATDTYSLYSTAMARTDSGSGITRNGVSGSYTYTVAADFVNRPVNLVTYWDACRFVNWLCNGQKVGAQDNTTTEDGTYKLNGYVGSNGTTIQRKAGWTWAIPSEDEWYKAAYYKGGGTDAGYWLYPTQSNSAPGNNMADPDGNEANYYISAGNYPIDSGKYTTTVGQFLNSASAYGTYDQAGNVSEWDEALPYSTGIQWTCRELRGGSFDDFAVSDMQSTARYGTYPDGGLVNTGFRVCRAVPEPSSILALLTGLVGLAGLRRRKS